MGGGMQRAGAPTALLPIAHAHLRPSPVLRRCYAFSVIPAQAGIRAHGETSPSASIRRRSRATWASRRDGAARTDAGRGHRSCLRRNDGKGAGMAGRGCGMSGGDRSVVRVVVWYERWRQGCGASGGVVRVVVWCEWWCGMSGGVVWAVVWCEWWRGTSGGAGSLPPTPHLASPLKGGRDELGKGREGERVGVRIAGRG